MAPRLWPGKEELPVLDVFAGSGAELGAGPARAWLEQRCQSRAQDPLSRLPVQGPLLSGARTPVVMQGGQRDGSGGARLRQASQSPLRLVTQRGLQLWATLCQRPGHEAKRQLRVPCLVFGHLTQCLACALVARQARLLPRQDGREGLADAALYQRRARRADQAGVEPALELRQLAGSNRAPCEPARDAEGVLRVPHLVQACLL